MLVMLMSRLPSDSFNFLSLLADLKLKKFLLLFILLLFVFILYLFYFSKLRD